MTDESFASPWEVARRWPDRPALIMADTGERVTYAEMTANANRLAQFFVSSGLKAGDCVAFFLENSPRYLELVWAAKLAGLYYVCMPRQLTLKDAAYILGNSRSRVLIASHALAEVASGLPATASDVRFLMLDGAVDGFDRYERVVADHPADAVEGRPRGASMLYSSGTTGRPKGVRHDLVDVSPHQPPPRHGYLVENFGFDAETVFLNPGPFYHTAPLRFMMHAQREGATAIGFRKFDAEAVLGAIETHRATHGFFVPTMFVRMLALPEAVRRSAGPSSMRVAIHGAAPIAPAVKQRMIEWWGPVLYEMYGGTESNGTTIITSQEWLGHKGSVGRPSRGSEIHIVGPDGEELPPGETGLVYMASGKSFEYFGEPEKTAESRHPKGWSTLGDVGHVDADGYLYLTDRASNLIISGGVNVYPQEAENVLAAHPDVADVAVFGVPDDDFGEAVKGLVVPAAPVNAEAGPAFVAALIAFCRAEIGSVKTPRSIDLVESLPRSEAGKIIKAELRRRYWPEGGGLLAGATDRDPSASG